jgi:hypothetical protein
MGEAQEEGPLGSYEPIVAGVALLAMLSVLVVVVLVPFYRQGLSVHRARRVAVAESILEGADGEDESAEDDHGKRS